MDKLTTETSADLATLKAVARDRLRDFEVLKDSGQYSGAIYMGRYVIEVYLKCLICRRLKKANLPKIFHSHNLKTLLFFTGLNDELRESQPKRFKSFERMDEQKIDALRYQDSKKVTVSDCNSWDKWLNHHEEGLVPWLRKKLR